ncbi:MAG: bifunctional NUDIX hydrolase family protein/GNAT family N-acetyltransferase [Chloroflexota bacterium]|nr:bifunctional NUDIX hydrolase family protein/GNAT family N-acetyltransferase [Chloroflexota bacterium]
MNSKPGLVLCFLQHGEDILMLHRHFPPNQGLWNGVGGHIQPGETPREAVIREVAEETSYRITGTHFVGLLTWDGFEIPPGGIVMFTAEVPHKDFLNNHEGNLAWKSQAWACTSPDVVDNIHVFLPKVLAGEKPQHYHFSYKNGERVRDRITDLPEDFDLDRPYHPNNEIIEEQRGDYLLSTDRDRLQLDIIEDFLSKRAYWAEGRKLDVIERSIQHSVCLGIYHNGLQVAFARLVTDEATFAWLADVYVDDALQGQGLGRWLLTTVCQYVDLKGIKRTVLATKDAQEFYKTYGGFEILASPEMWMSRKGPEAE